MPVLYILCIPLIMATASTVADDTVPQAIAKVKPAVVGIATYNKLRSPAVVLIGSGFVVKDGLTVVTNAHVVKSAGHSDTSETIGIVTLAGKVEDFRPAKVVRTNSSHDLALLAISGSALPALELGDSGTVQEGQTLLFTGFPIGMVLGFHAVTHRAMVSAITPVTTPAINSRQLNASVITQVRNGGFHVFQLDGTAYPGNSGSPLYDPTGRVLGVVNKVFVKSTKEAVLAQPSGISYAIPARFVAELITADK